MIIRKTPRKKTQHPIFPYLIKNMTKYDYTCCFVPRDNETSNWAIQWMKKERVRWTPTRKATYRNQLIQRWNAQQSNPFLHFHRSWMVRDMYQSEPECIAAKQD